MKQYLTQLEGDIATAEKRKIEKERSVSRVSRTSGHQNIITQSALSTES